VTTLQTQRLALRPWREADIGPFAALNADPEVMRYFPTPLTRAQSDALAERARARIAERGWGLWAVEVIGDAAFIGSIGLAEPRFEAHFTPAVEVGWRLAREQWGNGYAVEGARAAVAFGFEELGLGEIVADWIERWLPRRRFPGRLPPEGGGLNPSGVPGRQAVNQHLYRTARQSAFDPDAAGILSLSSDRRTTS
jgi:RimJ/RimL family protein N-acetyltransferase